MDRLIDFHKQKKLGTPYYTTRLGVKYIVDEE